MKADKKSRLTLFFQSFLLLGILVLSACQNTPAPAIRATEEFYINDRPGILLNATKWTILTYSEDLYDDSQTETFKNQSISGAQVVVTTYVGAVGDINTTELFNSWEIGDNDMGILIVLFFTKEGEEYQYQEMVFEIGARMAGYLSAFSADGLITDYFNDPDIPAFDYDQRLINLYFAVLQYVYLNVYDYSSYNFQSYIDEYETNKYEYFGLLPSDYETDPLPTWAWVLIIIGIVALGVVPGGYFIPMLFFGGGRGNSGGGGRSGGYWFRR